MRVFSGKMLARIHGCAVRFITRDSCSGIGGYEPVSAAKIHLYKSGVLTCSGRKPMPIIRPRIRLKNFERSMRQRGHGSRARSGVARTRAIICFCIVTCNRCVRRVGNARRRCTRARCSGVTAPSRQGPAPACCFSRNHCGCMLYAPEGQV